MSDIVGVFFMVALLAAVTVVCVWLSRRLAGRPRADDEHAARLAQARATVQREDYKAYGAGPSL